MDGNGWSAYEELKQKYYTLSRENAKLSEMVNGFHQWMTSYPFAYPARLLSLNEARAWAYEYKIVSDVAPVFCEFRDKEATMNYPPWRLGDNQRALLKQDEKEYGVTFRFWSARPSEAQMALMPWKNWEVVHETR